MHGGEVGVYKHQVADDRNVFLDLSAPLVEGDHIVHRYEGFHSGFVQMFLGFLVPAVGGSHRVPVTLLGFRHTYSALAPR